MKKSFLFLSFVLCLQTAWAKKVLFEVDLSAETINPNGIHLSGDFQAMLGFGPDWDPGTLSMTQVGATSIYRVVLNLPAFRKYEYRFVNGNQTYEAEFVPEPSRLGWSGGNYSDNRWVYVDSLTTDTLKIGALIFAGNAPAGQKLIRYQVELSDAPSVSANGIHVGTSYQNSAFDPATIRMYNRDPYVFDIINYTTSGTVSYLFYNGNAAGNAESVPGACQVSGKRTVTLNTDSVLPMICFSSCANCLTTGLTQHNKVGNGIRVYPNPSSEKIYVDAALKENAEAALFDLEGRKLVSAQLVGGKAEFQMNDLATGIYLLTLRDLDGVKYSSLVVRD